MSFSCVFVPVQVSISTYRGLFIWEDNFLVRKWVDIILAIKSERLQEVLWGKWPHLFTCLSKQGEVPISTVHLEMAVEIIFSYLLIKSCVLLWISLPFTLSIQIQTHKHTHVHTENVLSILFELQKIS